MHPHPDIRAEAAIYWTAVSLIVCEGLSMPLDSFDVSKGVYEHYLAKEIAEQPSALLDTIRDAAELDPPSLHLDDLNLRIVDLAIRYHERQYC